MNQGQLDKLSMYRTVLGACKSFNPVKTVPAFTNGVTQLEAITSELEKAHSVQLSDRTGITEDKNLRRENLVDTALIVAGGMHAWANDNNNNQLMARTNLSASDFKSVSQGDCIALCELIAGLADTNVDSLADWGIDAALITNYKDLITNFKDEITSPRDASIERTNATVKISEAFNKADQLIKNCLDKLVFQFKISDTDFYNTYISSRKIIDRGRRSSSKDNGNGDSTSTATATGSDATAPETAALGQGSATAEEQF